MSHASTAKTESENKAREVTPGMPRLALNETDAAHSLGFKSRTLQEWRRTGEGPAFLRVSSRCVRYRVEDLEAWAASRVRQNTGQP